MAVPNNAEFESGDWVVLQPARRMDANNPDKPDKIIFFMSGILLKEFAFNVAYSIYSVRSEKA